MRAIPMAILAALACVGLAGPAAADGGDDCLGGSSPVPSGYYTTCVLEENAGATSYGGCSGSPCHQGSQRFEENVLALVHGAQYLGPTGLGAAAWAYQYDSEGWYDHRDSFAHNTARWDNDGTTAGAHAWLTTPFGFTSTSAGVYQADSAGQLCSSRWGCSTWDHETTVVTAEHQVGPGYVAVTYQQLSTGGGPCSEHVVLATTFGAYATPAQPCAAALPHLMDDPATRFPDWPDGTGLPFL